MSPSRSLTIAMVAGEASGDLLGAALIAAIKQQIAQQSTPITITLVGIGGEQMQQQGLQSWYDMDELSVMGIVEVLKHLPRLLQIRRQLRQRLTDLRPDLFIGIDAPDFNLTLEAQLKQQGIKTVHYVSPSVWAWRQKRVFKIAKATDLVLAFLPFEKAFYDKYQVPCRFIGHTLADQIPLEVNQQQAKTTLSLASDQRYLALLPGSRHNEVAMLSADFLQAAQCLQQRHPDLQLVAAFSNLKRQQQFLAIKQQIAADLVVTTFIGQARTVMMASDVALLASGTVALECMLAKCPMVVAYRLQPLSYFLAKRLVKIPYVSLPNILSQKMLVPELLQEQVTVANLVAALEPLLTDRQQIEQLQHTFRQYHQQLRQNASQQAAKAVLELLAC